MKKFFFLVFVLAFFYDVNAQRNTSNFKVIGFFTARHDVAHITFVHEANKWFAKMAPLYHFTYDSTNDWSNMNEEFLSHYNVVLFLDTRPDSADQRKAFQQYMENGGGWIGFHFAAFALTPSAYPENWDWYHHQFLGSGQYRSNTWRPTSAILKVEDRKHPVTRGLHKTIKASPNEWYRWENDLTKNPDIDILMSIDPKSFPLGTGPKQNEIWHSGYYPVVWTNKKFRMLYVNMGHNDIDYEHKTNEQLSNTFGNPEQDKMIINALLWLGKKK
jgi:type 1 glutamine amidotransferase